MYVPPRHQVNIRGTPLGQFQHTAFQKDDVYQLLQTINKAVGASGERALTETQLEGAFEVWWPRLEERLKSIASATGKPAGVRRSDRDLLEEILEVVRGIQRPEPTSAPASVNQYKVTIPGAADWPIDQKRQAIITLASSLRNIVANATFKDVGSDLQLHFETKGPGLERLKKAVRAAALRWRCSNQEAVYQTQRLGLSARAE